MVRSFTVRESKKDLVANLGNKLDKTLLDLQNVGWEIKDVVSMPVKEWDYPEYFDSTAFVIIAERNDFK